ncbi:MAG: phage head closure protein [Actinomycetes bacterium]
MIDAGKLRDRITVQIASGTTNALGETVLAWSNSTSVWASVDGVSAREALTAGQQEVSITHKVRLRYLPGLTQQMRFSWRSRTLDIVSLLEHDNRSEHEAICQERRDG